MPPTTSTAAALMPGTRRRSYRYLDLVTAIFVTVLLCSNLIGPSKTCMVTVFGTALTFGAGNLFFPVSYIFDDVLTEVYGYAKSRKVIWAGFGAMVFATVMSQVVIHLPPDPREPWNATIQPAIEAVFGGTWRIVVASMLAFWAGDFANSYVLAKMKILTGGRWLWTRTIGSTIVGEGLDSLIFYPVAFAGVLTGRTLVSIVTFNWCFKVVVEIVMTPATYAVCDWLKRAESEDFYDRDTDFNPFTLKD
jgi:queuosine precursor transporter